MTRSSVGLGRKLGFETRGTASSELQLQQMFGVTASQNVRKAKYENILKVIFYGKIAYSSYQLALILRRIFLQSKFQETSRFRRRAFRSRRFTVRKGTGARSHLASAP